MAEASGAHGAYGYLAAADPVLGMIIGAHGRPDPFHWGWTSDRPSSDPFRTLLLQIVSQHVSTSASFTVFDRLQAAAKDITPERILALGRERLMTAGLTDRKADAALGLSDAVAAGGIRLDARGGRARTAVVALPELRRRPDLDLPLRRPRRSSTQAGRQPVGLIDREDQD